MTLNEAAILDQKIAVGLVENPCCWALEAFAAHAPAGTAAVEIGAFRGRTAAWLALGVSKGNGAKVFSVDPWENGSIPSNYADNAASVAEYTMSKTRLGFDVHMQRTGAAEFVTPVQATAVAAAKTYDGPPVSLLWHDGLHRAQDVAADLRAWMKHMADDAVIVLHDTDDDRLGVAEGARRVLTTKVNSAKWSWGGQIVHRWAKNAQKKPGQRRRGFTIIYSRESTFPQLRAPITERICK